MTKLRICKENVFFDEDELTEKSPEYINYHKLSKTLDIILEIFNGLRSKLIDLERINLNYKDLSTADKLMSLIIRNKLTSAFMVDLCRKLFIS